MRHSAVRRLVFGALLLIAASAHAALASECPPLPSERWSLPVSTDRIARGLPVTILAFGSSSTEGVGASAPERTYPVQLAERLREAFPNASLRVLNRGRGGEDAEEMLARLESEVLAEAPDLVIWQAGANGILKRRDPEAFRELMARGLSRLAGKDVILMDSQRAAAIVQSPLYGLYRSEMDWLDRAYPVVLFSRDNAMRRWETLGIEPSALLSADGLHHNDRGYSCVAHALADAIASAWRGPGFLARR